MDLNKQYRNTVKKDPNNLDRQGISRCNLKMNFFKYMCIYQLLGCTLIYTHNKEMSYPFHTHNYKHKLFHYKTKKSQHQSRQHISVEPYLGVMEVSTAHKHKVLLNSPSQSGMLNCTLLTNFLSHKSKLQLLE
ncbi:Hypothetical_protein [Hexamita inflata]|uniref:Hypothetical_protein n=1 Tax=Hexamita inflata TaxID=28002 RepID=A0AA86PEC8_9EUKA|nr:Hypothetical protein HINF_LOCUS25355 [Hexamita inflata]CAI9957840.1 Hypothetical protein HINF_LOCUS45485 [Hexamita inflata]